MPCASHGDSAVLAAHFLSLSLRVCARNRRCPRPSLTRRSSSCFLALLFSLNPCRRNCLARFLPVSALILYIALCLLALLYADAVFPGSPHPFH